MVMVSKINPKPNIKNKNFSIPSNEFSDEKKEDNFFL